MTATSTKTRRTLSPAAQAAKMIRATIKTTYPTVAFKVTSDSFAGGDAVRISWADGPLSETIDKLTSQYEYGHFDGSIDLYEYSNMRSDLPQTKYVQTTRRISDAARRAAIEHVNAAFGWDMDYEARTSRYDGRIYYELTNDQWENGNRRSDIVHRLEHSTCMICPECSAATLPGDRFCPDCGHALPDPRY